VAGKGPRLWLKLMEAPDSDKREDDRWDGAVNQFVGGWGH